MQKFLLTHSICLVIMITTSFLYAGNYGVVNIVFSIPKIFSKKGCQASYSVKRDSNFIIDKSELAWWMKHDSGRFLYTRNKNKILLNLNFLKIFQPGKIIVSLNDAKKSRRTFIIRNRKKQTDFKLTVICRRESKAITVYIILKKI